MEDISILNGRNKGTIDLLCHTPSEFCHHSYHQDHLCHHHHCNCSQNMHTTTLRTIIFSCNFVFLIFNWQEAFVLRCVTWSVYKIYVLVYFCSFEWLYVFICMLYCLFLYVTTRNNLPFGNKLYYYYYNVTIYDYFCEPIRQKIKNIHERPMFVMRNSQ